MLMSLVEEGNQSSFVPPEKMVGPIGKGYLNPTLTPLDSFSNVQKRFGLS